MNNTWKIFLVAAIMMPLCMIAVHDSGEMNENNAEKLSLVRDVPGINSDMRPQMVENDFDLTGERLAGIRGPRHGAISPCSPWDVLRSRIQYLPEDVKLRALQHFEQIDHKGHATIDDAVALADRYRYGDTVEKRIQASYALLDPYTQAFLDAKKQSAQKQNQNNTSEDQKH
jgi:hypothetical protein